MFHIGYAGREGDGGAAADAVQTRAIYVELYIVYNGWMGVS